MNGRNLRSIFIISQSLEFILNLLKTIKLSQVIDNSDEINIFIILRHIGSVLHQTFHEVEVRIFIVAYSDKKRVVHNRQLSEH